MNNETVARDILSGGGEMGERMRSFDWGKTSLGNVEDWPQSLKTCVRIILTSRQPMFVWWGKELINLYNDAYLSIIGGKHPWALGQPAREVWREIWDAVEPRTEACMRKNEGTYDESLMLIMHRNGYPEETYYTFSYSPVPGDDGEPQGIICANSDDTQRILSERQLRTLKDLGKKLGECRVEQDVFERTIDVLQQNPHDFPFAILYRVEGEGQLLTQVGKTTFELPVTIAPQVLNPADLPLVSEVIQFNKSRLVTQVIDQFGALPSGPWQHSPDRILLVPVLQGGQKQPYAIMCVGLNPYRQPDEKYTSFFELVADQIATGMANVQAIEEERKRAEALAEIDKAKTVFFSNISHEFRTPLTLMLGPLEQLLGATAGQLLPEHRQDIASTHRNAMRLLRLVNNLLDFSRMEAGRVQARFAPVDLPVFTADLAASFTSVIESAGLHFEVNCEPLPEPVYLDREMWEKIVLNLLSNAFKYTLRGRIDLRLFKSDGRVVLQVADTGIGIPKEEIPRMFERFHRVENNAGRTFEGTGIGLSLVKELVTLHHGSISLESTEGRGSVFTVTVPMGKDHLPPAQVTDTDDREYVPLLSELYVQEAVSLTGGVSVNEKGYNKVHATAAEPEVFDGKETPAVLVVDDNADMRAYIQRLLEKKYQVETAANGKDALDKIQMKRPDLVVSDIMMPVMDGIQLLNEVKNNRSTATVPVILVSARAGEEARIAGFDTGADDYLIKPFSARELIARVQAQLKIARLHQSAREDMERLVNERTAEINQQKEFVETLLDASVDLIAVFDREFRYVRLNKRASELYEKNGPLKGVHILDAFPGLVVSGMYSSLQKAMEGETVYVPNYYSPVLNRNFENFYVPIKDDHGHVHQVMAIAHDNTEVIQAAEKLQLTNEQLIRSNQELEQFAYVASHDLQEPLRKIQTFTEIIETNGELLGTDTQKYLQKITAASERMATLIKDLLNLSRISNKQQVYEKVNLNQVLAGVRSDLELMILQKNAVINSSDLPVVEGISIQLNQLFYNIIGNSLKFSRHGVPPEIDIHAHKMTRAELNQHPELRNSATYFCIRFTDNGIGFDQSYAEQIFSIFQQLNDRMVYEGTGIGLALCKKIVVQHHGKIYAVSGENKGASFYIILPGLQPHEN